ncbi:MAG TPA: DinB family protein [Nocardioides sp.]|nr:DinB family protein [Nocardioides sp.]
MAEYFQEDLSGSRFENVDLQGSRFHNVDLSRAVIRGALMLDAEIDGDIEGLRVNGVEVAPLVEAELDRRYPQRAKMRPTDAAGFREAWSVLEQLWAVTVERARRMPPEELHERVDGEWSFIETLRHLVMATDAWVGRAVLGDPTPFHPLGLPHTEMGDVPGVPHDPDARPSLDEVLAVRAGRMATVREVLADLTDERLAGHTEPVEAPGYPPPQSYAVRRCLGAIVNEEWHHRLFAERDLDVLDRRRADRDAPTGPDDIA